MSVIGKKGSLESGYIYAPYIPMTTTSVISGYTSKNVSRKRKINKIFGLDLDIKDEFSPSKSLNDKVFIPMGVYHRVIKGTGNLKIKLQKLNS